MKKINKILVLVFIIVLFSTNLFSQEVNILLIMPHNYGANYNFNRENFEEMGWKVTTAGITKIVQPCVLFARPAAACKPLTVDYLISEITDVTKYDCIAIMPAAWRTGEAYGDLLASRKTLDMLAAAVDSGVVVWATCAGVRVLARANVISGVRVVSQDAYKTELEAAGAIYVGNDHPPVIDGNIVTCARGQYYHVQNCDAIATALEYRHQTGLKTGQGLGNSLNHESFDISQKNTIWTKTFGSKYSEAGRSVCETTDGGYIVAGFTYSFGEGYSDVYLLKTDSTGNEVWMKTYGGEGWDYGYSVCQTQDGGYAVAGYTSSFGAGLKDVYLIKTDSYGDTLWTKTIGGPKVDVGRSICETENGDLVICGFTQSEGNGEEDVYLIKTASNGELLWTKTYGYSRSETGQDVCVTNDGGLIIVGSHGTENLNTGNQDFYLIKTDENGIITWQNNYGNSTSPHPFDWANSVCLKADGGFIAAGNSDAVSPFEAYVVNTDAEGNEIWKKNYGERFYDYGNSIAITSEGNLILCGATKNNETEDKNLYLTMLTPDGEIIWSRTYGGSSPDWGSSVCMSKDGNMIITGHTGSYGAGDFDVWLMKVPSKYLKPKFDVTPSSGHAPLEINFNDESLGDITSWQWDFNGDGITDSHDQNPVWTYENPGNYSISLIVSDGILSDTLSYQNLISVFNGESALKFNDNRSIVTCPASSSLNLTENLTIEAWINPTGWGANQMLGFGRIIDKQKISIYLISSSPAFNDHCLAMQAFYENGTSSISMSPENSITLDEWQHIAITYQANSSEMKIYINGIEQTISHTIPPSGLIADNSNFDLLLGNNPSKTFSFQGAIDELRIWKYAHSEERIATDMNRQYIENKSGMVACWGMNEGFGDTVADKSDYGNEGILSDVSWYQGMSLEQTFIKKTEKNLKPDKYTLYTNYPNPFNPETTIRFYTPVTSSINLAIYDITGRLIKNLINNKTEQGFQKIVWNSEDNNGNRVSSGIYFYKLSGNDGFSKTRKMILLK